MCEQLAGFNYSSPTMLLWYLCLNVHWDLQESTTLACGLCVCVCVFCGQVGVLVSSGTRTVYCWWEIVEEWTIVSLDTAAKVKAASVARFPVPIIWRVHSAFRWGEAAVFPGWNHYLETSVSEFQVTSSDIYNILEVKASHLHLLTGDFGTAVHVNTVCWRMTVTGSLWELWAPPQWVFSCEVTTEHKITQGLTTDPFCILSTIII